MTDYQGTKPSGGRNVIIVVAVVALLALLAYALGLFNVEAEGDLKTPEVTVSGGEIPEVDVNTADIDVGTEPVTVDVPTVDVEPAEGTPPANN